MKKLFLLILILASNLFAQGWNDIVTVYEIEEPEKTDIFTNSSGIHILIRRPSNTNIVYYNLNSAGEVDEDKTITFETSGDFPNIIGTNDKIYAIYKTGNNIRIKYSTDNGSNWLSNITDILTTANFCNGVDAVYNDQGVHLVWATQDGGASGFETYYYRLNTFDQWVDYKNVTDVTSYQYGGNPSVTVSPNRVHVSFNTDPTTSIFGLGDVKTRDKNNGNWETPQTVVSGSEQSLDERLLVRGEYLYLFYNRFVSGTPDDLRFRTRRVDNTTGWSGFTTIESGTLWKYEDAFEITKTTNDNIHILYKKYIQSIGWSYTYKYYNGTTWFTEDDFDHLSVALRQIGLSSVSNDLFCTWVKQETPTRYMRFRQYDAIPLAPQNLTISQSQNNHPYLTWVINNEPDINLYKIYRNAGSGAQYIGQTTNTYYEDVALSYCTATPPATCPENNYIYHVTAVDLGPNESEPSNTIKVRLVGAQEKASIHDPYKDLPSKFILEQNYPNPFNPATTIAFSIPKNGIVTIKVYDILGTEVAELVNEAKEAGNYSVNFNASVLPNGIYFYTLTSGNFMDTKKLILLK